MDTHSTKHHPYIHGYISAIISLHLSLFITDHFNGQVEQLSVFLVNNLRSK